MARALGVDAEVPDVDAALAEFDKALLAEPTAVNTEQDLLLRGIGLRR